jgi:hypothetical protein
MKLSTCSHDTVLHVVRNMRSRDCDEIYNLRWDDNPFSVMNTVMARPDFSWVAWHEDRPIAVFGGMPRHPGVWSMFCFATDEFGKVALGLTRFARHTVVPTLFDKMGAHRLECESHEKHFTAHRWLGLMGANFEGVKRQYGKDGSDYFVFTVHKSRQKQHDPL